MSLTTALGSSVSSLQIVQDKILIVSNNIANVDTPGYIKQSVHQQSRVTDGVGQGVEIASISADVDAQLLKSIQTQTSQLGYANVLDEYFDSAQNLFGQPDAANSLSTKIDQYFAAFQKLSDSPQTTSLRLSAVNSATDLANRIADISRSLQQLRLDADREISNEVSQINTLLTQLENTNSEIIGFPEGSTGRLGVEQNRELALRKLSEYIDISTNVNQDGILTVLTGDGIALLESSGRYVVTHSAAPSINNFINDLSHPAITVSSINSDGTLDPQNTSLVSGGKSSAVTTSITSGTVKGLIELRDTELPKLIAQLDNLAKSLIDQVNAISNDGTSFPPPSSLTGTLAVKSTTQYGFDGKVMIAVVDSDGSPASSPYGDETNFRPLTLDLSTLNSGGTTGEPTLQTIVDEINDYFGPPKARAVVGNLRDISLAVYPDTDSIANQGTVKFDLQLDNVSTEDATVVVQAVTIQDAGAYVGLTAPALPTTGYVVNPGDRERTNVPITVDFSGGPDLASYTVRVRVQVTDASGNVSVADIDYQISDNVTDVRNDRYPPTAVTGVSGTSDFYASPSSQGFLTASIVDANGTPVSAGSSGFLKLTTNPIASYGVAIDELDSSEVGLAATPSANVTNRGFSHYFQLNNFFNPSATVSGAAINMSVRSDIKADSSKVQMGELILSNQPDDTSSAIYTYELGSGNNKVASRISSLSSIDVTFASAGTLPAITTTFNGYSTDIIGFVATTSLNFSNNRSIENLGLDGLKDFLQESSGVNKDVELAKMIEFQSTYEASAKIISIIQELFRTLSQAF